MILLSHLILDFPHVPFAPGVFTMPMAEGTTECEAEHQTIQQCPMSICLHGKHTFNYSQDLVICKL